MELETIKLVATIIGIIVTLFSIGTALYLRSENKKLKRLQGLREWLNSDELDDLQKEIWNKFNKEGGTIYDTKIFSVDYQPNEEYALSNLSTNLNLQFTRILTLETKNKRAVARMLFNKISDLSPTRQRIQLFHNYELTDIYLDINQIVPEPTYNFLINNPHNSEPEAIFAWSKNELSTPVAGFQIADQSIIQKLENTHVALIDKCEKIRSLEDIDKYALKEYDLIKHRFNIAYSEGTEFYDIFATNQINNSTLITELSNKIKLLNRDNLDIIDIGCGTGIVIDKLSSLFPNCNFLGIDPVDQMLQKANSRCGAKPNVKFENKSIEDFENTTDKFDVVISTWGFFNWLDKGTILEDLTADQGQTIYVNNQGDNDDFHKLWPEPAITFFEQRRNRISQLGYSVNTIDSFLNLETDEELYNAVGKLFGKYTMIENKKDNFRIKIMVASKQKN